jgi:hypothetical protein
MDIPTMHHRLQTKGIQIGNNDLAFNLLVLNDALLEGMVTKDEYAISKANPQLFDIKKMQSILLAKGIRIADDDPLLTLLAMNEIALEDIREQYQRQIKPMGSRRNYWKIKASLNMQFCSCCLIAFTLCAFCRINPSWQQFALAAIEIVLFGYLIYLSWAAHLTRKSVALPLLDSSEPVQEHQISTLWTEDEFIRATNTLGSRLSTRTLEACLAVLVHGDDVESPAIKHFVLPAQVRRAIRLIEKHNLSARS